jgi:hypothetical protein
MKEQDSWVINASSILYILGSQSSFSTTYMFSEHLSLKYHYILSIKRYLLTYLSIQESLNLPKEIFCRYRPSTTLVYQAPGIGNQLSWPEKIDQITIIKRFADYPSQKVCSYVT